MALTKKNSTAELLIVKGIQFLLIFRGSTITGINFDPMFEIAVLVRILTLE